MKGKMRKLSLLFVMMLLFNLFVPAMNVAATEYGSGRYSLKVEVNTADLTDGVLDTVTVNDTIWSSSGDEYLTDTGSYTVVVTATANSGYEIELRMGGNSTAVISEPVVSGNTYTYTVTYNTTNNSDNLSLYPYSQPVNTNPNPGNPNPGNYSDIQVNATFNNTTGEIKINNTRTPEGASYNGILTAAGTTDSGETNIITVQTSFGMPVASKIIINGTEYNYTDGNDVQTIEVAGASEYTIEVYGNLSIATPKTIIWTNPDYKPVDDADAEWASHFSIGHGYAKAIAVYDEEGNLLPSADYIMNGDVNSGGVEDGFGMVKVMPGYRVIFEFVPEYGYQLTEITINDQPLEATSTMNRFEFIMPNDSGNVQFGAKFTATEDVVTSSSQKVAGGSIELGNALPGGSAQLSVSDVELSSDKISGFENAAGEYTISNYLDIDLYNVYYKGKNDSKDVWSDKISELEKEATISIKLEDGVNAEDIVIVHNIHDGDEFEVIEIESYDPATNTITFKTKSFSSYAIATKPTSSKIDKNPDTGDSNIMLVFIGLIGSTAVLSAMFFMKKRENRR
ncbi:MAG: LPXTG cell wall anchor domain-containing protein [Wujia sp.]